MILRSIQQLAFYHEVKADREQSCLFKYKVNMEVCGFN